MGMERNILGLLNIFDSIGWNYHRLFRYFIRKVVLKMPEESAKLSRYY